MQHTVVVAAAAAVSLLIPVASSAAPNPAAYGGRQVDLAQGWGTAEACVVTGGVAECFADRSSLSAYETELASTCGTPLRLYADAGFRGRELDLYDRGVWENLGTWGFGNALSSYRIGSCGAYLADGVNGGGAWYPGSTAPGHAESAMASGWNDRVSSILVQ